MRFSVAHDFAAAGRPIRETHIIVRTTRALGRHGENFAWVANVCSIGDDKDDPSASHALRQAVNYPNSSMIGLPVVIGVERPVLFCGSLSGMSSAW